MADNAVQSVQKLLQDPIAPDVRETRVRLEQVEERMDAQFESMRKANSAQFASVDARFESMRRENEANTRSVLSAIGEMKSECRIGVDARCSGVARARCRARRASTPAPSTCQVD